MAAKESRAKRLGRYLEQECGWNVFEVYKTCSNCYERFYGEEDAYCSKCGKELDNDSTELNKQVIDQLESAIRYAIRK